MLSSSHKRMPCDEGRMYDVMGAIAIKDFELSLDFQVEDKSHGERAKNKLTRHF